MVRQILEDLKSPFPHPKLTEWLESIKKQDPYYEYSPPTNSMELSFSNWYLRTREKINQGFRPQSPIYKWVTAIDRVVVGMEEYVTYDVHFMALNDDFMEDYFNYRAGTYYLPEVKKEYMPNRGKTEDGTHYNWRITDTNRTKQFYDTPYSSSLVQKLLDLNDEESGVPIKRYITYDNFTYSIPYFISKSDFALFSISDLIAAMKAGIVSEELKKKYYHHDSQSSPQPQIQIETIVKDKVTQQKEKEKEASK